MEKKNVESFLDLLDAQIFCFQGNSLTPLKLTDRAQDPSP
jgi:hypothetical protein